VPFNFRLDLYFTIRFFIGSINSGGEGLIKETNIIWFQFYFIIIILFYFLTFVQRWIRHEL
jgi:hypothetical protein